MSVDQTVTQWIELLKEGDEFGVEQIWRRYFQKLCRFTKNKLPDYARHEFDEEDVALSAIESFSRGAKQDKFPQLNDRNNLWALLVVISSRKIAHKLRDQNVQKRGGKFSRIPTCSESGADLIHSIVSREPTPEFAAEVSEEAERLLAMLAKNTTRQVAELKMSGYTNEEIADQVGCGKRTVERKLMLIRRTWTENQVVFA